MCWLGKSLNAYNVDYSTQAMVEAQPSELDSINELASEEVSSCVPVVAIIHLKL